MKEVTLNKAPEKIPTFFLIGDKKEKAIFYKEDDQYFIFLIERNVTINSTEKEYLKAKETFINFNKLMYKMMTEETDVRITKEGIEVL
jgi:hypothetical protein